VTIPERVSVIVTGAIVQPFHPASWSADAPYNAGAKGAVGELQQKWPMPVTLSSTNPAYRPNQKFRVRFRDVDDAEKQFTDRGFQLTIFGTVTVIQD
jgi:hypothetical protein